MLSFIENRILVSSEIICDEYSYYCGSNSNVIVNFTYFNRESGRETTIPKGYPYKESLNLARQRRSDGRYKNFDFIISIN